MSHQHRCPCGAVLTCPTEPDHCAVTAVNWTCPTCDMADLDAWGNRVADELSRTALATALDTLKEN